MEGSIRWVPPLPAGWEAKYEPTQKRYFFINHSTKQTTWDDPRFSRGPPRAPVSPARVQAAQPQSQNYGYGFGAAQRQQQHHQQQRQAEALPMKHMVGQYVAGQQFQQGSLWQQRTDQQAHDMAQLRARQALQHHYEDDSEEDESSFVEDVMELEVDDQLMHTLREQYPSCPAGKIRSILEKNCNALRASQLDIEAMGFEKLSQSEQRARATSQSNNENYAMVVQRLKREFNQADITLIQDIINQCDGDEINARNQLKTLGFKDATPAQEAIPERHRDLASEERERQRTLSSSSTQRAASPQRPSLTAREKETMITKLCREFPNLDRTIVQLAFETAGSTEDKARRMLQFMYTDNSSSATSPKRTTSPVRQARSPPRSATTSPSRSTAATTSNNLATSGPSTTASSRPGSSKSHGGRQTTSPPKSATGSSNNAQRQQQQRKAQKHVTRMQVNAGSDRVVTSQQQIQAQRRAADHYQVFVSNNRTTAKGPDPSLSEGPDLARVERYGVMPNGPNRDLRKGPNRNLVKGSQGAVGPDPSLRRGPQANLRRGPQADLCRGPAFQKSPTRVLVSNI